ncbi:unnamed protein product [Candidula unifasciata]|uniref:Nudix hydrolase domain-containing protein n=1 Tax=Candidula unifasciata TaxID=100452 RepID=A0A8S3ZCS3_9EUPU|nr:unnamed protein product [Candidula unifasciata]
MMRVTKIMAATLKHWRESASLIISSKRLARPTRQNLMNKFLTPAAAVADDEVFRLLLLKRSGGSSFMPDVYVFPGGMLDNTDFSKDWLEVLGDSCGSLDVFSTSQEGSPIFSRPRDAEFSHIPSEVALRITAIRETFEESGILLARPASDLADKDHFSNTRPLFATVCNVPEATASKWRKSIMSDPSQFLVMCRELGMVPDVWSLYEWSNWLTPPLKGKRFDTAFFVSCIDEGPNVSLSEESSHGVWMQPEDILQEASRGSLVLAPPQVYELSRLVRFQTVDELVIFAWKRSSHRAQRWMPVIYSCADATLFVLPGDDLYPDNADLTGEITQTPIYRPETVDELQKLYPNHNRAVMGKDRRMWLYCNIQCIDGHILPYEYNRSAVQPKL